MVETEVHDEIVEWFDSLSEGDWERVSVVVDRLAGFGVASSDAVAEESR